MKTTDKQLNAAPASDLEARNNDIKLHREFLTDARLKPGERMLFGLLLDYAMDRTFWLRKGVVAISLTALSQRLKASPSTLRVWTRRLVATGYISTGTHRMPSGSITTYIITGLEGRPA